MYTWLKGSPAFRLAAPPHPRSSVQPVLHDADELLVGQLVVVIHVEDLEDGVDEVPRQLQARGHVHGSSKLICRPPENQQSSESSQVQLLLLKSNTHFPGIHLPTPCHCHLTPSDSIQSIVFGGSSRLVTLSDGARGKVVHLHGDGEVLQVVEELEEGPELVEGDALEPREQQ